MRKIAPGVKKSLYPLDYNRENPMSGFNEWSDYIRMQNIINSMGSARVYLIAMDCSKLREVLESKCMNSLLDEANHIINKK